MTKGIELRSFAFLDSLQPQYAAFLGTVAQGFCSSPGMHRYGWRPPQGSRSIDLPTWR